MHRITKHAIIQARDGSSEVSFRDKLVQWIPADVHNLGVGFYQGTGELGEGGELRKDKVEARFQDQDCRSWGNRSTQEKTQVSGNWWRAKGFVQWGIDSGSQC